ncbi:MAG: ligase [Ramlibacter sp.]|jgi:bifunctional non-homologous end joining protein LigD|nr:ligase [Ramlibacter sp.]
MSERLVTLYCREGGSDKVYQLHLHAAPAGAGWVVDRGNGPRGKALRMGTMTEAPIDLAAATKIFEQKLKEQLRKGYHEGEQGQAYSSGELAGQASGHRQQLPTPISAERAAELLRSPGWYLQEKANGERRSLVITPDGQVKGINKLGLFCPIPAHWPKAFERVALDGGAVIDGEQVGDHFHAFDVLSMYGNDIHDKGFDFRAKQIERLVAHHGAHGLLDVLRVLPVSRTPEEKAAAVQEIEARKGEGYVLKHRDAPYDAGRSTAAYKVKFVDSPSCLVLERNRQRSVRIGLLTSSGEIRAVGNVTIPANHQVPEVGEIVDVQCLYYNPHGAFEQPVYLGRRTDVAREECHFGQLVRLKPETRMPAELWGASEDAGEDEDLRETMRA